MKTVVFFIMVLLPWMQEVDENEKAVRIAENLIEYYFNSEYEKIIPLFDEHAKQKITIELMKEAKQSMYSQVGVFENKSEIKVYIQQDFIVVEILCHFKKTDMIIKTYVNKEGLVSGWGFFPIQ